MKITRKQLLCITAFLGVLIIVYSLVRHFTGLGFSDKMERCLIDGIVIAALGLFMYNRKLARDEKQEQEAKEAAALKKEVEPEDGGQDEALPHWERQNGRAD
ncbi:MAG: hypothetical protein LBP60_08125 [Spirochaetaceae bacterium]|jgi:putative Mn2+ efflux pump MntP|nr:hypothetical protein [Spirochaetaceae bacterium]